MGQFAAGGEQLYRKVESDRTNPFLSAALAYADLALGRKEDSIQGWQRAMEMLPISDDAVDGPSLAISVAQIDAWTNRLEGAFAQLNILVKLPGGLAYGDLKTNPNWDPLRRAIADSR